MDTSIPLSTSPLSGVTYSFLAILPVLKIEYNTTISNMFTSIETPLTPDHVKV